MKSYNSVQRYFPEGSLKRQLHLINSSSWVYLFSLHRKSNIAALSASILWQESRIEDKYLRGLIVENLNISFHLRLRQV